MRKENPQHRGHISAAEKAKIRRLTKAGVRQSEIARRLNITAPSVSKAQRAMGLPTVPPIPEKKILRLFRKGWGGLRISKHLHCPANRVWEVMHKHRIHRADGTGSPTPKGDIEGFTQALKNREGYIKDLAKRFGLGICKANEIAHDVLKTIQFRPGASRPPLSSNFPQKHHRRNKPPNLEPAA